MSPAPDWKKALLSLRDQFIRGAPERFGRIALALGRLENDCSDAVALRSLRAEFHAMSGLGGTYGFPRVTQLGSEGERQCDGFLAAGRRPETADVAAWKLLLGGLQAEVAPERPDDTAGSPASSAAPRILLVADDREEEDFLRSVLESAGYELRAVSPEDRWEAAAEAFSPDLILIAASAARVFPDGLPEPAVSARRRDELSILFLTTKDEHAGHVAAGIDHLVKPVSPGLLLSGVASRIERVEGNVAR